ncbi:MAG: DUF2834 domain-containing protein [Myxococcales bacterium]|nr:DUF2834 domain-containing protein [Myxococcales bacterium]
MHETTNNKSLLVTVLLSLVLVDFLALTVWVIIDHGGLLPAMSALLSTRLGQLATFDLLISLSIATVWMVRDARRRQVSALPYLALTLLTGSAGPLLYVIRERGPA